MRVVITGLEGSLLDPETESYGAARQALAALERRSIPLIVYGDKPRSQMERIRVELENEHPFIAESGMVVYLPEHYFPASLIGSDWREVSPYQVRALGLPHQRLRQVLQEVRSQLEADLVGFGDWTTEELAIALGITVTEAKLAQTRDYSEVFSYFGDENLLQAAFAAVQPQGYQFRVRPLQVSSSLHFWYLTGQEISVGADPIQAARILLDCYQRHQGSVVSLGVGSTLGDVDFLNVVRTGVVLPSPEGDPLPGAEATWRRVSLPGPEGWNEAVLMWLEETDHGDESD